MSDAGRRASTALIFIVLLLSIPYDPDRSALPFAKFWGLDLHNIWLFHHCSLRNHAYANPNGGTICGDVEARTMKYPPLLYWSFIWTRFVSFPAAIRIWSVAMIVAMFAALLLWGRGIVAAAASVLLLVHYPFMFSVERGNSDIVVIALWTVAWLAWRRERVFFAGCAAGLAVAAKVYPLFAVAIIVLAIPKMQQRMRFLAGCALAALVAVAAFARDSLQYVAVLGAFAAEHPQRVVFGHGLPTYFAEALTVALAALLIGSAGAVAWRSFRAGEGDLAFAIAIAVSTFFARTSYDYNLITTYPLVIVLISRLRASASPLVVAAICALTLSVEGNRYPFRQRPGLFVLLEVLSLGIAALAVIRVRRSGEEQDRVDAHA